MNPSHNPFVKALRLAPLALASLLTAASVNAADPAPADASVEEYPASQVDLRLGGFLLTNINTTLSLTGSGGNGGTIIDFGDTLGGETSVNIFRADVDWNISGPHLVQGSWYNIDLSGHKVISKEIDFGDEVFPINATVDSQMRSQVYKVSYGYTFHEGEKHEFTGLIGVHVMTLETGLSAANLGKAERFEVTAPLPAFGVGWTAHWARNFQTRAVVQYFGISVDDKIEGSFVDALFAAEYRMTNHFSFGVGYNYFKLDVDAHKGPLTLSADYQYDGFLVYIGAHF
jgi:hypothetical protein